MKYHKVETLDHYKAKKTACGREVAHSWIYRRTGTGPMRIYIRYCRDSWDQVGCKNCKKQNGTS